ncbi:hypothetical protein LCY76_16625 [Fictibacillus sp. KIGAM418]|uniref:Uncharacterized protein n=1 Tax=Fictibacillus marinisediminis TaxID=2878389 RepID=A0A9X1XCJ8_9BACL|nr:hypothetical protein [Fictibacillus marinisediminis]MCK6258201.1 hypothetical protein [Fictibacillus marinisediminis]
MSIHSAITSLFNGISSPGLKVVPSKVGALNEANPRTSLHFLHSFLHFEELEELSFLHLEELEELEELELSSL